MADRENAYASAVAAMAAAEGNLDVVQDELFVLAGALRSNDELAGALADPSVPVARRQQIVEDLLSGKASRSTLAAMSMIVAAGRSNDLERIAEALAAQTAAGVGREVAVVRSAIELDTDQKSRLAAALAKATGKQVEVRVVVDPSVLGGIVAQVGDTVIDGSVRRRLDQLKQAI